MSTHEELEHIALLAEVDSLTQQLQNWISAGPEWKTATHSRSLLSKLLDRVHTLRIRLETPLIVATYGGTGTGKSSLVNALAGQEVSASGRQRPTTVTPTLLLHRDIEPDALGLNLEGFRVEHVDTPALRDFVLIDCPDPDTSETASSGSNLEILRSVLPHCDVLLYTSTQQKYRNARIVDELGGAAAGCRLVFVQTHAALDTDIREDWKTCLDADFTVPDMFFVDSVDALARHQAGSPPTAEFARLLDLLSSELGTSRRVQIRRANLIELLQEALSVCKDNYDRDLPAVHALQETLNQQRAALRETLTRQLCDELLVNRSLWERRLLSSVTDKWGFSPFSAVLRFYNGIGGFIASFTFFRARTSAQMALIGAVHGARWMKGRAAEQEAESSLARVSSFGISDDQLQESRMVIAGHVREAGVTIDSAEERNDLTDLRRQAATLEEQFLGDASRSIDETIEELAQARSGWFTRLTYETLLMIYIAFLLGRIGYNFFWTTFLGPATGAMASKEELLRVDFYIPALLFLVIWSGSLVAAFTMKLRRGLTSRVQEFAQAMADSRLIHGLFPRLEQTCRQIEADDAELAALSSRTSDFRAKLASGDSGFLGARKVDDQTDSA